VNRELPLVASSTVGALTLVAAATATVALYLASFGAGPIHNVGFDADSYVVQSRAAAARSFEVPGVRPGVGASGAFVSGTGSVPIGAIPAVVSLAAAVCLGLAAAAAVTATLHLPAWAAVAPVVVVATWGGTGRLAAGYLANLVSLVCFVAAIVVAIRRGPGMPSALVAALLTASVLAHPGLLPAYAAIVAGWCLVTAVVRRGRDVLRSEAVGTAVDLAIAAVISALALTALGIEPADLTDFTVVAERFDEHSSELLESIVPLLTAAGAFAGVAVAWRLRRPSVTTTAAALAVAWLAVSWSGVVVFQLVPTIPAYRTLLLGVPAPALAGVAIGGSSVILADRLAMRWPGHPGPAVASATLLVVACAAWASLSLVPFQRRAELFPGRGDGGTPGAIAGYLRAIDADRPLVVVTDPELPHGIQFVKIRRSRIASLAPDSMFLHVAIYLGDERNLFEGRPTIRPMTAPDAVLFNRASRRSWPHVRSLLDDDPIVVVARPWSLGEPWDRAMSTARWTGNDLAVLRGPAPSASIEPVAPVELTRGAAALRIALVLLVLAAVGGGWSSAFPSECVTAFEAIATAPALGLGIIIVVALGGSILGVPPGDPLAIALVASAALAGWFAFLRRRRTAR
jgi:hypothetical protein